MKFRNHGILKTVLRLVVQRYAVEPKVFHIFEVRFLN